MKSETDYKLLQEQWVTGHGGGSLLEIITVVLAPVASWMALQFVFRPSTPFLVGCVLEFLTFVLLTLLCMSSWSTLGQVIGYGSLLLVLPTLFKTKSSLHLLKLSRKRFITVYRALMMNNTCIAILAVDFALFPRRFAKVETFGISIMDIGVGAFVFSQGMVSHHRQRSLSFRKACLSSLPLFFLGFVRLMLVKASNYQEHVSEYGLHWNFFFTLAFLPPFVVLCRRLLSSNLDEAVVGLVVTLLHQAMLSFGQWEQWVLKAPRETWISANKEGLCSLFGYLAIYFCGARLGKFVLQLSPPLKNGAGRLFLVVVYLWALYALLSSVGSVQTSRRLGNSMYVLCTVAFNTMVVLACLVVDLKAPAWSNQSPVLLQALNRNALVVFLVANLLTGLINKSMYTLFVPDWLAFVIIISYMAILVTFAVVLDRLNVTIKL